MDNIKEFINNKYKEYELIMNTINVFQEIIDNKLKENKLDNINDLLGRLEIYKKITKTINQVNPTNEKIIEYCEFKLRKAFAEDEYKLFSGQTDEDLINHKNNGIEKACNEIKEFNKKS